MELKKHSFLISIIAFLMVLSLTANTFAIYSTTLPITANQSVDFTAKSNYFKILFSDPPETNNPWGDPEKTTVFVNEKENIEFTSVLGDGAGEYLFIYLPEEFLPKAEDDLNIATEYTLTFDVKIERKLDYYPTFTTPFKYRFGCTVGEYADYVEDQNATTTANTRWDYLLGLYASSNNVWRGFDLGSCYYTSTSTLPSNWNYTVGDYDIKNQKLTFYYEHAAYDPNDPPIWIWNFSNVLDNAQLRVDQEYRFCINNIKIERFYPEFRVPARDENNVAYPAISPNAAVLSDALPELFDTMPVFYNPATDKDSNDLEFLYNVFMGNEYTNPITGAWENFDLHTGFQTAPLTHHIPYYNRYTRLEADGKTHSYSEILFMIQNTADINQIYTYGGVTQTTRSGPVHAAIPVYNIQTGTNYQFRFKVDHPGGMSGYWSSSYSPGATAEVSGAGGYVPRAFRKTEAEHYLQNNTASEYAAWLQNREFLPSFENGGSNGYKSLSAVYQGGFGSFANNPRDIANYDLWYFCTTRYRTGSYNNSSNGTYNYDGILSGISRNMATQELGIDGTSSSSNTGVTYSFSFTQNADSGGIQNPTRHHFVIEFGARLQSFSWFPARFYDMECRPLSYFS